MDRPTSTAMEMITARQIPIIRQTVETVIRRTTLGLIHDVELRMRHRFHNFGKATALL